MAAAKKTTATQTPFEKILTQSNSAIKAQRAKIASEDAFDASHSNLIAYRKRVRNIEREILKMEDMNRDSELSLKVVKDDWNPTQWIANLQAKKVQLLDAKIDLQVAESIHTQWFGKDSE